MSGWVCVCGVCVYVSSIHACALPLALSCNGPIFPILTDLIISDDSVRMDGAQRESWQGRGTTRLHARHCKLASEASKQAAGGAARPGEQRVAEQREAGGGVPMADASCASASSARSRSSLHMRARGL